jgi:hypothetical protein
VEVPQAVGDHQLETVTTVEAALEEGGMTIHTTMIVPPTRQKTRYRYHDHQDASPEVRDRQGTTQVTTTTVTTKTPTLQVATDRDVEDAGGDTRGTTTTVVVEAVEVAQAVGNHPQETKVEAEGTRVRRNRTS